MVSASTELPLVTLGITTKASSVNSAAMTVCTHTAVSGTRALFTCDIAFGSRWSSPDTKISRANE